MTTHNPEADYRFMRFLNKLVWASIPVLFAGLGWAANSLVDHETRISIIESNRYTSKDAEIERKELLVEIQKLREAIPPAWFKARVDDIAAGVRDNGSRLVEIEKRIVRLESK